MTPREFQKLPLAEQVYIVFNEGNELLHRIHQDYLIKLYGVFDFYVEIWYRSSTNKIDKIRLVNLDEIFNQYENEFDISDLFKEP